MSTEPKARAVAATSRAGDPGSVMSATSISTSSPVGPHGRSAASTRADSRREDSITRTPSRARASAEARPRPREPATTRADLPSIPSSTSRPLGVDHDEPVIGRVERFGRAVARDDHDVLESHPELVRQVDARLHREGVTGFQQLSVLPDTR